jgi:hypothetical protein
MERSLFTTRELLFAVGLTALAGFAALALGHGRNQTLIMVEIGMIAGFASVLRTRHAEAKGRRLFPWQPWMTVGWFGLAAIGLLLARTSRACDIAQR